MAKTKVKPTGPKARNDSYVMMLFITFLAIVGGCVLMYLDNEEYGNKQPPPVPKIGEVGAADSGAAGKAGGVAPPGGGVVPPAGKGDGEGAPKGDGK